MIADHRCHKTVTGVLLLSLAVAGVPDANSAVRRFIDPLYPP